MPHDNLFLSLSLSAPLSSGSISFSKHVRNNEDITIIVAALCVYLSLPLFLVFLASVRSSIEREMMPSYLAVSRVYIYTRA